MEEEKINTQVPTMLEVDQSVVRDTQDVRKALERIGITPEFVEEVARSAAAARADTLAIDPSSAPGLQSYIFGVRAVRMGLLPLGWRLCRNGNVESTVNDEMGVQLCFQNVDMACVESHSPRAISRKGAASRSLVQEGQGELFPNTGEYSGPVPLGSAPTVWVICVYSDDARVCAEVSCPKTFSGTQFEDFHQRIFVFDDTFEPPTDTKYSFGDDELEDFDVQISKK